ncbi:hypothetical protein STEG23_014459, partial [Scotinomys teguina]
SCIPPGICQIVQNSTAEVTIIIMYAFHKGPFHKLSFCDRTPVQHPLLFCTLLASISNNCYTLQ